MKEKKPKTPVWIDFDGRLPKSGQKIRVLREMEFEALWNGKEATKVKSDKEFAWTEKTYWQPCD